MGSSSLIEKRGAKNKTLSWALGHKSSHGLLYEIQSTPTDPLYTSNSHFLNPPPPHPTHSRASAATTSISKWKTCSVRLGAARALPIIDPLSSARASSARRCRESERERERSSLVRSN
jgi:hypothetical protein